MAGCRTQWPKGELWNSVAYEYITCSVNIHHIFIDKCVGNDRQNTFIGVIVVGVHLR